MSCLGHGQVIICATERTSDVLFGTWSGHHLCHREPLMSCLGHGQVIICATERTSDVLYVWRSSILLLRNWTSTGWLC